MVIAITQDDYGVRPGILFFEMFVPYCSMLSHTNLEVSWLVPIVIYPTFFADLGTEKLSLLVFVELGHKQLFLSCEHRWRSFRNHLKYRRIVFKFTKFSPVLQIYLIDNKILTINLVSFRASD